MTIEERETAVKALTASLLDTLEAIQAAGEHLIDMATSERVALEVLAGGFTRISPNGVGEHVFETIPQSIGAQAIEETGKR